MCVYDETDVNDVYCNINITIKKKNKKKKREEMITGKKHQNHHIQKIN